MTMLAYYCQRCKLKNECDRFPQRCDEKPDGSYYNPYYAKCFYRAYVVKNNYSRLCSKKEKNFYPRCSNCKKCYSFPSEIRQHLGVYICYNCYKKTKKPYGNKLYY